MTVYIELVFFSQKIGCEDISIVVNNRNLIVSKLVDPAFIQAFV
jgi:hypothetical protein